MKISRLFFAAMALFTLSGCVDIPEPPYNLPTGGENGTTEEGENLLANSDLEIWNNGTPEGWGETVTNSTYSQSTDEFNSGNYAVIINGDAGSNKRFASKSYTLKAGEYTLGAYLKKSGETLGQYRLGYAKLTNGKVADTQNDYNYITSATAVPTDWKKSTCSFTLDTDTEIAIIIMNSKYGEGAAILVDDITLTTTNGGISDGATEQTKGNAYINETFAAGLGKFTTVEKVGSYAWKFEEYNGNGYAKVSGYANGSSQNAESWLISPSIDLSKETKAYISFSYVINKGDVNAAATNHKLLITANYTGDVATTEWSEIDFGAVNDETWTFKKTGKKELPETMIGKNKVVIAFKYISTETTSSTWELNNLIVDGEIGAADNSGDSNENGNATPANTYISESLTSTLGTFTTQQKIGNYPWSIDATYSCAKATSYVDTDGDGKADTSNAAESWLVSQAVDFTSESEAYIAFEYIIRYAESGKVAANHLLLISKDYNGDVATATWTDVAYNATEGSDWNTFYKANVAIPAQFMGKNNIVIALCYKATDEKAGTWEVKNFIVAPGKASEETPETTPDAPSEGGSFTVSQAIAAYIDGQKIPATITGYIVGAMGSNPYKAEFSGTTSIASNILIADDANETDSTKCVIVQLSSGSAARKALNLVDNPANYKKKVEITGSLEKYFNAPGLKSVTAYEIDGVSSEPDTPSEPDEPETPDTPSEPETPDTPDTPSTPDEQEGNYIANHSFENWSEGKPVSWGGTGNNATIEQSTDAHSGSYSALVKGNSSSNKRLASNSYTLPAGTYTLSAYLKQSGENAGQFRIGYVKLTNGAIESNSDYTYLTDAAPVSSDWTEVSAEMVFNETTEIAIIIMNNKVGTGAPILVDDVTLIAK